MRVTRLVAHQLRCFEAFDLAPGPGMNVFVGDNGAGKTSILEALHLMAYGRSFRGRVRDGLVRSGADALDVFVEWSEADGARVRRSGLRHSGHAWQGRLDGAPVDQISQLCAALVVVSFEPGSHALISGGGEPRRRFLDWGLFHVEHDFFALWRRYARALRQRNALLKSGAPGAQLDAWDHELAEAGAPLSRWRAQYVERLESVLVPTIAELAPGLGQARLEYLPGWRSHELSLADALLLARDRDRSVGHTTVGPHRADWRVAFASMPQREPLSRGQAKLAALCCLMAQARDVVNQRQGEWPVMVFDDLASELDRRHQQRVLDHLHASGAQVFISGTEMPAGWPADATVFHVEHGRVTPASTD